jgi:hypothetical protein
MPLGGICPYGYMALWSKYDHMAISPYDHMASKVVNMGISGNSNKDAAIW